MTDVLKDVARWENSAAIEVVDAHDFDEVAEVLLRYRDAVGRLLAFLEEQGQLNPQASDPGWKLVAELRSVEASS